tara:strand:+ start:1203 stop:1358 length:156 start_codon:yes stop_codon:yes gene_type:complete
MTDKEKISELCYELVRLRDENTSFLKTLTDIELSKIAHDESEYRAWMANED